MVRSIVVGRRRAVELDPTYRAAPELRRFLHRLVVITEEYQGLPQVSTRRPLVKEMGELYKLRNKISHAGKKIDDKDAEDRLCNYSISLLAKVSKMSAKFKSVTEFRDWIKDRRFHHDD